MLLSTLAFALISIFGRSKAVTFPDGTATTNGTFAGRRLIKMNTTLATLTNTDVKFNRLFCYLNSKPISSYKDKCCAYEARRFRVAWKDGGHYLTTLLERLQRWECEEFQTECKEKSYQFTPFNRIVYQRFCFPSEMHRECRGKIQGILQMQNQGNTTERWDDLVELIDISSLSGTDLIDPCVSMALFDRSTGGVGRFHEVVERYFPFCGLQWNGYDFNISMSDGVSVWTGLSSGCRGALVFFMTLMVLLGILTIAANLTILIVFGSNKKLRNSQAIFQMSLAIADLIVGLVVWPNMVAMQVISFINPLQMGELVTEKRLTSNGSVTYFPNFGKDNLERRFPASNVRLNHDYKMFLGFVVLTSIVVSVTTLMAASFDRLSAVSFPLQHRRRDPKRCAVIVCVVIWVVCIIFCLLPAFVQEFEYDTVSSILVSADGTYGTALALVALIVPLIVTWVVSTITFQVSRRHRLRTKAIFSTAQINRSKSERRLAKTLALMVGVFTISVLPAIVCIVVGSYYIKDVWQNPKSINIEALNAYSSIEYVAVIVLTMNSLWNCLIYSVRNPGFRKTAKDIVSRTASQKRDASGTIRDTNGTVLMTKKISAETKRSPRKSVSTS